MNKAILFLTVLLVISLFVRSRSRENFEDAEIPNPRALAVIRNGSVVDVRVTSDPKLVNPSFYKIVLSSTAQSSESQPARVVWNNDRTFTVVDPGRGYVTPPVVNFIPRGEKSEGVGKKPTTSQMTPSINKPQVIQVTSSGMWDDIPQNEKDVLAAVTQDYLREQKYSESILQDMYSSGVVSNLSTTSFSIEWMYPIEFSRLVLSYTNPVSTVKLIQVTGYNENGVELFAQDLIYASRIEWKYRALVKKLKISNAPKWDNLEVWGRRVYWTCEEYDDFIEQLKESTDKPGAPSSKYEDDDTTVLYSEVLAQLPDDFKTGLTKTEYIDYYSTMASHCHRKTKEQIDSEKLVEDQEIANYKQMIKESQEKTSMYKEKLMKDYRRMQEQYALDQENQKDAQKYGIPAPEFKYTKDEIDALRKRIESIQNVPEDKLLRDCAKLEKTYNKQRKNAEKWAKASIFLPFLKKKAKRESRKSEKSENKYQQDCAELVSLSYSY